jgi:Bacterial regulatory helix-turn-helix protein, lysR family
MRIGNRTTGARLRIVLEPDIAIGPGKADLLEGIRETGSIAAAGRRLGMSYKRAWLLVETMNACFKSPLVEASRGGRARSPGRRSPTSWPSSAACCAIRPTQKAVEARGRSRYVRLYMSGRRGGPAGS